MPVSTRRKGSLVVLGLTSLVIGAAVWWRGRPTVPEPPKYTTAKADRGAVIGRVTATGTLSALVTVQVGAQVSGRVQSLHADFNSRVTKGQVLATLDPELFQAALAQTLANEKAAEANVAKAAAQSREATRRLARAKALAADQLVSAAEVEAAEADADVGTAAVAAAEGGLAQARAARRQAQVNATYTTIRSPIDGTVISRAVDVGQTVAASLQAPTLFTIAENLQRMQVDTNVSEADVGKLHEGLSASFTVDAFPNRTFGGTIRQIRYAPQVVQNVVTYDAVIDVDNADLVLRPGMTANVTFVHARVDDVLRIPNAALRFRMDGPTGAGTGRGETAADGGVGSDRRVWILKEGQAQPAMISTGLTDGTLTEVRGGSVATGDEVIVDKASTGTRSGSGPPAGMGGMRRMF